MGKFDVGDPVRLTGSSKTVTVKKGHKALLLPSIPGSPLRRYRVLLELDVAENRLNVGNPPIGQGSGYRLKHDLGTVTINNSRLGKVLKDLGGKKYRVCFYYPLIRHSSNPP